VAAPIALVRIVKATRPLHAQADADRLAWMDIRSADELRRFLERVYGFEHAVELDAISLVPYARLVSGLRLRMKSLRADLAQLGVHDPVTLPRVLPHVTTPARALGWLLVAERHVLLARLIHRVLSDRPSLAAASTYLTTHANGGEQFRAFGEALGDIARRDSLDEVEAAAREAFAAQHRWYARPAPRARSLTEPRASYASRG
jgi:heme oxygenase